MSEKEHLIAKGLMYIRDSQSEEWRLPYPYEVHELMITMANEIAEYEMDYANINDVLDDKERRIAELEAAQRWTPVGEALPEQDLNVVVKCRSGKIFGAFMLFGSCGAEWFESYNGNKLLNVYQWRKEAE